VCTKYCQKKRQQDRNEIDAMHFFGIKQVYKILSKKRQYDRNEIGAMCFFSIK